MSLVKTNIQRQFSSEIRKGWVFKYCLLKTKDRRRKFEKLVTSNIDMLYYNDLYKSFTLMLTCHKLNICQISTSKVPYRNYVIINAIFYKSTERVLRVVNKYGEQCCKRNGPNRECQCKVYLSLIHPCLCFKAGHYQ